MTIRKRFMITAGALLLLSTISAVTAIVGLNSISSDAHVLATDSIPGTFYAAAVEGDALQLRGDYLRHIAETDTATIQEVDRNIVSNTDRLARDLKSYQDTISGPDDQAQFDKMKPLVAAVQNGWEKVGPVSREGKKVEAFQLYNTYITPSMSPLKVELAELVTANKRDSDTTMASTTQTVRAVWWLVLVLGIVSLVFGVGVSWFMISALNRQLSHTVTELSEGAEQISSAASQVASSSQSLAQGASEQAASLEETSSVTEEINSMAARNTDNSGVMTQMVSESQLEFAETNRQLGARWCLRWMRSTIPAQRYRRSSK